MGVHLLIYRPIKWSKDDWRPLLQQQAILAVARAVAAHHDVLLAPAHPDVMTLLATTGGDRAQADPHRQVRFYREAGDKYDPAMEPLLGESEWIGLKPFNQAVQQPIPQSCIFVAERPGSPAALSTTTRLLHLRALSDPGFAPPDRFEAVDGDPDLHGPEPSGEGAGASAWDLPKTSLELEPFIALGVAFERALFGIGRPG
jgi:hypothetical protein